MLKGRERKKKFDTYRSHFRVLAGVPSNPPRDNRDIYN